MPGPIDGIELLHGVGAQRRYAIVLNGVSASRLVCSMTCRKVGKMVHSALQEMAWCKLALYTDGDVSVPVQADIAIGVLLEEST
jgi:hypothetical protein